MKSLKSKIKNITCEECGEVFGVDDLDERGLCDDCYNEMYYEGADL